MLDAARQAERISAARAAAEAEGVDVYINARIDVFLRQVGPESGRFADAVKRAKAYVAAGASGVFVPGVIDAQTIGRLADAIEAPLNIMAGPGAPSTVALQKLGVARVSTGPGLVLAVMMQIRRSAAELFSAGTYDAIRGGIPFGEANALFPASR
jgi:2-methylisocitrate lyase-like PEP mutase family enzyme